MKLKKLLPIIAAIALGACNNAERQSGASSSNIETTEDGVTVEYESNTPVNEAVVEQCPANDLALFIAGKPSAKYALLQEGDKYKAYSQNTQKTWNDLNDKTLKPIKNWCEENIPDFYNDTTCLFYPFGGPDLIFAMTFFPKERDYVLFGLEKPGQLIDPDKLAENQLNQYLDSLQYSFRYLNKYGFFVAKQMLNDFKNKDMDGTLHLALYTLALENCTITRYRDIYLDDRGEVQTTEGKNLYHPYGWEITFKQEGDPRTRTVKYLKFNAEDEAINGRMEFPFFLNNIKEKTCYFKAASYLMQSVEFTTMQKLILNQCDRILQDESGFSYARIKKGYSVTLFGTYTDPVRDFKIFPQNDLRQALINNNCRPLPFKIGYAAQHNESVLMACVKGNDITPGDNTKPRTDGISVADNTPAASATEGITMKVQFLVSWHVLKTDSPEFNGLSGVEYYQDGSHFKYTVGNFKTEAECQALLKDVKAKGFADAFIVKFQNGKRIK
ncbi:MAG: hypothetical protein MJZ61_07660 [Bacteroidales bacterium]|nr:hypothetical protein [Bacteroidales bacterium]